MRNLFVKTALVLCTTIIFLPATVFATEPQNTEVTSAEEGFTDSDPSVSYENDNSLRDMKDYNNHAISKKQQEKFLEMGENLNIFYSLDEKEKDTSKATDDLTTLSGNSAREPQTSYMPCKAAVVIEGNEIYIPISQAQDLCREIGEPSEISKVYLKINGKNNLENAKKILSGI